MEQRLTINSKSKSWHFQNRNIWMIIQTWNQIIKKSMQVKKDKNKENDECNRA